MTAHEKQLDAANAYELPKSSIRPTPETRPSSPSSNRRREIKKFTQIDHEKPNIRKQRKQDQWVTFTGSAKESVVIDCGTVQRGLAGCGKTQNGGRRGFYRLLKNSFGR